MRFFPVDYKKDFEFVRTIDNSFDPRFFKGTKAKFAAGAARRFDGGMSRNQGLELPVPTPRGHGVGLQIRHHVFRSHRCSPWQ